MTKDELEAAIAVANTWSGRSTLVLAIGILGEYVLLPFLETKRWQKAAKIFFAALVVAGIFGEYEFSSQISQNAGELQRLSDTEVADARAVASKADDHAKSAEASGKQLGIDVEVEKQKTARFQREADTVRLALEKQIQAQGPRWRLLENGRKGFIDALKSFAGQPITVVICGGPSEKRDVEAWMFEQYLLDFLGKLEGANWATEYKSWPPCGGYAGVQISVGTTATEGVKEAAKTLHEALIRLNIAADLFPVFPEYRSVLVPIQGPTSPEVMALNDPKSIFVLVGSNSMLVPPIPRNSRKSK